MSTHVKLRKTFQSYGASYLEVTVNCHGFTEAEANASAAELFDLGGALAASLRVKAAAYDAELEARRQRLAALRAQVEPAQVVVGEVEAESDGTGSRKAGRRSPKTS